MTEHLLQHIYLGVHSMSLRESEVRMKCEELGEEEVRRRLALGLFTENDSKVVSLWQTQKDEKRKIRAHNQDDKRDSARYKAQTILAITAILVAITIALLNHLFGGK